MKITNPDPLPNQNSVTLTTKLKTLKPSREDCIDAGFLLVLLATAFIGFSTTFNNWWFAVPVLVGLFLGLIIAKLIITIRWPAITVVASCLLVWFLVGPALSDRVETWYGLPTPTTTVALARAMVSGWKAMLTTLPPLASNGIFSGLIFLLALLSAGLGYFVARKSAHTSAAIFFPLLTLGTTIALGTMDAPFALLEGIVFAGVGFLWLAIRYPRMRKIIGSNKPPKTSIILGAGALVLAISSGVVLGGMLPGSAAENRQVARNYVVPPLELRNRISPLTGFRKYSSKALDVFYNKELMRVNGASKGALLRFAVMDSYNRHVWSATGRTDDYRSGFVKLGAQIPGTSDAKSSEVKLTVLPGYAMNNDLNLWLPSLGKVSQIIFSGKHAHSHGEAVRFNLDTNQGVISDRLQADDTILLNTTPWPNFTSLPKEIAPGEGRRIPDADSEVIAPLAQSLASEQQSPIARLRTAAEKLRAGAWSDGTADGQQGFLPGHGEYRLKQFVTGTEFVGSDEQYSAIFALLANRYGFPARVVIGASVPESTVVKGKDVKAWVEIQVADNKWVTVPTDVFTPNRSKVPSESPKQADDQLASTNVPPPNPPRPPGSYNDMLDTDPARNRIITTKSPISEMGWMGLFYVVIPIAGISLVFILILLAKMLRRRCRRRRGEMWARISAGWRELLDLAKDIGQVVPADATRLEQGQMLGGGLLSMLAAGANAAVFGGGQVNDKDVEHYWVGVNRARAQLLATVPRWRAMIARISLRSFLPAARSRFKHRSRMRG